VTRTDPLAITGRSVWCTHGRGVSALENALHTNSVEQRSFDTSRFRSFDWSRDFETGYMLKDDDFRELEAADPSVLGELLRRLCSDAL
jgi:hypothetical protein